MKVQKQKAQCPGKNGIAGHVHEGAALVEADHHEKQGCNHGHASHQTVDPVHEIDRVSQPQYPHEGDHVAPVAQFDIAHSGKRQVIDHDPRRQHDAHRDKVRDQLELCALVVDIVDQGNHRDDQRRDHEPPHVLLVDQRGIPHGDNKQHAQQKGQYDRHPPRARQRAHVRRSLVGAIDNTAVASHQFGADQGEHGERHPEQDVRVKSDVGHWLRALARANIVITARSKSMRRF